MTKVGKDAFGVPDEYGKKFNDYADEVEKAMPDPQARDMFKKMRQSQAVELSGMLDRHVSQESENLQDTTFKTLVSTLTDDAVSNYDTPGKVAQNLGLIKKTVADFAAKKGLTGDASPVAEQMFKKTESDLHVGVINRMVAANQYELARSYYGANKAGISGLTMDNVEKQIKDMEWAHQKDLYLAATNLVDKYQGSTPKSIVPYWDKLSLDQRKALEERSKDRPNDDKKWLDFLGMDARNVGALDRVDFETGYWSHFDKEHRAKAEAQWNAAKDALAGGVKANEFKSIRSDKDMALDALRKIKAIDESGKIEGDKAAIVRSFTDNVDNAFQVFQHQNGKNPTDEQKQKIINDLLIKKVYVGWWGTERTASTLTEDELKSAYKPLADIPRADRLQLVNLARAQGKIKPDISDDRAIVMLQKKIEKAYAAALAGGNRAQILSIINEE